MRTIKFRGKTVNNGEWVEGDLLSINNHYEIGWQESSTYETEGGWYQYEVQSDTVGQFTGLHDKNGKEIYEGDIINFTNVDYPDCEIIFNNASFVCNEIGEDNIVCELRLGFVNEVIGNIHDNPELKEGGEK